MLQNEGYEVVGVYMKLHSTSDEYHQKNIANVAKVAEYLGIKYEVIDFQKEFKTNVYDYFVDSYAKGITPNPCVVCNRTIKFGALLEYAKSLGIEKIATGHYVKTDGNYIYKADDDSKDQSYFLAQIDKEVLPHILFPLGTHKKEDIKKAALELGPLKEIALGKESSEICFVDGTYIEILERHMDVDIPGDVVDNDGNTIGSHKGYLHYTIGKRKGFDVPLAHDPHYITKIDPQNNRIVAGKKEELEVNEFEVRDINMFESLTSFECEVKVRYRSYGIRAHVELGESNGIVKLNEPAYGVASGQYAVFYDEQRLIGSGVIISSSIINSVK